MRDARSASFQAMEEQHKSASQSPSKKLIPVTKQKIKGEIQDAVIRDVVEQHESTSPPIPDVPQSSIDTAEAAVRSDRGSISRGVEQIDDEDSGHSPPCSRESKKVLDNIRKGDVEDGAVCSTVGDNNFSSGSMTASRELETPAVAPGSIDDAVPFAESAYQHRLSALPSALFVEDKVYDAEQLDEDVLDAAEKIKKWKIAAILLLIAVVATIAITTPLLLRRKEEASLVIPDAVPSTRPSLSPSYDPSPTLAIVQARGKLRCGLDERTINAGEVFLTKLCRAVAAVVLGDAGKIEMVPSTSKTRWTNLIERATDLSLTGDTHTIEREVRERATGTGFTFSKPFTYDGMVFAGDESFVKCCEQGVHYGVCSMISICLKADTSHYDYVEANFPSDFYQLLVSSTFEEMIDLLLDGTCNVIAYERQVLLESNLLEFIASGTFVLGQKLFTKEPLAIATRNNDREWSDIMNWVIQGLIFGEEQGLLRDPERCNPETGSIAADLPYLNAVFCVGNYEEILGLPPSERGMNRINNGTALLYALPFGNLDRLAEDPENYYGAPPGSALETITKRGKLYCGVIDPEDAGDLLESTKMTGMNVDFCRALAASIFYGDFSDVAFTTFTSTEEAYAALAGKSIDVIAGGKVEKRFDFDGFDFSDSYFHTAKGPENTVSYFSLVTREENLFFSSFVNSVVNALVWAAEDGITKKKSNRMPLASTFGKDFRWFMRYLLSYAGNYDEIYSKNFIVSPQERGRNAINEDGHPQLYSYPGLQELF